MKRKPKPQAAKPDSVDVAVLGAQAFDGEKGAYVVGETLGPDAEGCYRVELYESLVGEDVRPADVYGATKKQAKERAALIVRAVNTNAANIAALHKAEQALKDIMGAADNGEPYTAKELEDEFLADYNEIYAALRAAGEEV